MRKMQIFEPAMCCPTGLCGASIDPELLRVTTVLNTLKEAGAVVDRFNLTSAPMEFVNNQSVAEYLKKFGPDKLPVVAVDGIIVIAGRYPTNLEFTNWLELPGEILGVQTCCSQVPDKQDCCCGGEATTEEPCCCNSEVSAENGNCCCSEESCCSGTGETIAEEKASQGGCCCGGSCC